MSGILPQTLPGVPTDNVDPTTQELGAINNVADILSWLGAPEALGQAISTAMGGEPRPRDIVYIGQADWDEACSEMRIPVPRDDQTGTRPLKPLEKGHLSMVRRIARLRLDLTALEPSVNSAPEAATPAAQPGAHGGTAPQQTQGGNPAILADPALKLSSL